MLALAFFNKIVNSFCVNRGANQTSTLHDSACSFSRFISSILPPPTCAREIFVFLNIEIVSQVPFTQLDLPMFTT